MSEHQEHTHHITPVGVYLKTATALLILMALTIWSSFWDFHNPVWNNLINLTIAVIKATLVIMFFMGLKYSTSLTKIFGLAGFVWLTLMSITFGDYVTRDWERVDGWYAQDHMMNAATEAEMRSPLNKSITGEGRVEVKNSGEVPLLQKEAHP